MKEQKPIGFEIRMLSNQINRKINQMIEEEEGNLTGHQCWVLNYLMENPNREVFQRDIEQHFSIRRSTANHMLKLMEKNGYIQRISIPEDGRVKKLICTQKGQQACYRAQERLKRFEAMLLRDISREDIQQFQNLLHQMNDNLL